MIEGRITAPDRLPCIVPGCGRTFKREGGESEVICAKHWRMAPKPDRDRWTELARLYRRRQTAGIAAMCNRQWRRVVEAALDAAAGNINPAQIAAFVEAL